MEGELDKIFNSIDDLLLKHEFRKVNEMLKGIVVENTPTVSLITYLTATHPAKDKLEYRPEFYDKVKQTIQSRTKDYQALLRGFG